MSCQARDDAGLTIPGVLAGNGRRSGHDAKAKSFQRPLNRRRATVEGGSYEWSTGCEAMRHAGDRLGIVVTAVVLEDVRTCGTVPISVQERVSTDLVELGDRGQDGLVSDVAQRHLTTVAGDVVTHRMMCALHHDVSSDLPIPPPLAAVERPCSERWPRSRRGSGPSWSRFVRVERLLEILASLGDPHAARRLQH